MGKNYSLAGSVTTPNSSTLPIATLIGTTGSRPEVYDVLAGSSSAPADHSGRFNITRCSSVGTPGTSPTPAPIDPSDPGTPITTAGLAVFSSTPPTLGTVLLQWGQLQKGTFRFAAAPGKELKGPYTANNGLAFMNPAVDSTFTYDFTIQFHE